jgi:hypothetical protein
VSIMRRARNGAAPAGGSARQRGQRDRAILAPAVATNTPDALAPSEKREDEADAGYKYIEYWYFDGTQPQRCVIKVSSSGFSTFD